MLQYPYWLSVQKKADPTSRLEATHLLLTAELANENKFARRFKRFFRCSKLEKAAEKLKQETEACWEDLGGTRASTSTLGMGLYSYSNFMSAGTCLDEKRGMSWEKDGPTDIEEGRLGRNFIFEKRKK